ncbi:DUF2935 domain-containing protein [Thermosediminibacter oceani]|uniref:DUF2935 domain-containing protein n=1 Tax=Thermosediminibacter oceani (strain ATCC BAA-1034 / DSM 16646 / JW/IW-1228P) TaxID=555079 RepID=D9S1W5_THEOJ|nr:DUF2935 domain-containing protein [Thermosediminibacter oceani]ADL07392.1 conserved hypothetical protein [Thermosediminibacter oceani DSM 16646]
MSSNIDFVRESLDIHLFFARIMKEHSFFLEIGFMPKNVNFIRRADDFRRAFDGLLREVIFLANGVVSPEVLQSGEVITPYTLKAEEVSSFFTGVRIPTELTKAEDELSGSDSRINNPMLERKVFMLNQRAMELLIELIRFKTTILSNVLSCKMFTVNYPLLIEHIRRETELYLRIIQRIQGRENIDIKREVLEQELFWNRIMAEHAKFIRGLLDPTENELIKTANDFGNEFDRLTKEAKAAIDMTVPPEQVTDDSLRATKAIRDFKAQGTQGLLECNIRSIILPLLGDHVLREANHYLRLLKMFQRHMFDISSNGVDEA